jgi:AcrR family transcriptional regulator
MTADVEADSGNRRRRVGRPARISRDAIVAAAREIGLEDLTLRSVADHLGVSISALYHHVGGKDDLLRLAAEHALTGRTQPVDEGQHWAQWLAEWAWFTFGSFIADPGLLEQYLDGGISVDAILDIEDQVLTVLVRQGFSEREALAAFHFVTTMTLGFAVGEVRERRARAGVGQPLDLPAILARRGPDELPNLRRLVAEGGRPPVPTFAEHLTDALVAVALRRGDDVDEVVKALAQH